MKQYLLIIALMLALSCTNKSAQVFSPAVLQNQELDTSLLTGLQPKSLLELPQSQDGEIILSEGFYETTFKSYCLQPGTPEPGQGDAFTQMPLYGYRHDIVENILRNSLHHPELDQKSVQLLVWSTVSGSDYSKLSPHVKQAARTLLSSKEIFALQGGVVGAVKTVAQYIPEINQNNWYSNMRQLFEIGSSSYGAYENIAVLRQPSVKYRNSKSRESWYWQSQGYYVRYFPEGYQKVRVQVYVPSIQQKQDYLLFDPVTMMAVPANSNAQRLGIGAPVADVIRKVIILEKNLPKKKPGKSQPPVQQNPKGIPMD